MAKAKHPRRPTFPTPLLRLNGLQGGLYGDIELLAITRDKLELQLGADYVQLTRDQASQLYAALGRFSELGDAELAAAADGSVAEEAVVEVDESTVPRRRRRSRKAAQQSDTSST